MSVSKPTPQQLGDRRTVAHQDPAVTSPTSPPQRSANPVPIPPTSHPSGTHPPEIGTPPTAGTGPSALPAGSSSVDPTAQHEMICREQQQRPCFALSGMLLETYKVINTIYYESKRKEKQNETFNDGYDDKDGHYVVMPGEEIAGRFTVQEALGKGSFGIVLRAFDEKKQENVALKIICNRPHFRSQATTEIEILMKCAQLPRGPDHVVRLYKVFMWKSHVVLVFELMSFNLFHLLKCTRYNGVSLDLVRKFSWQLLETLGILGKAQPAIIHCDLKPENILLKNQNRSGIKLADFGSSCWEDHKMYKYIQSRYYRAPEVILGLPYGTAIDRWSLGCVCYELHVGTPLFPGKTELEQLQRFESVLGELPQEMISRAPKRAKFYIEIEQPGGGKKFVLKEDPGGKPKPQPKRLEDLIGVNAGGPQGRRWNQPGHDLATYKMYFGFLMLLLQYDPKDRADVETAAQHDYIMMAPVPQQSSSSGTPAAATTTPAEQASGSAQQTEQQQQQPQSSEKRSSQREQRESRNSQA